MFGGEGAEGPGKTFLSLKGVLLKWWGILFVEKFFSSLLYQVLW